MKLNRKTRIHLISFIILGTVAGSLLWAVTMRLIPGGEELLELMSAEILSLDLYVIGFFLRVNPGSFIGAALGVLLFRSLP